MMENLVKSAIQGNQASVEKEKGENLTLLSFFRVAGPGIEPGTS